MVVNLQKKNEDDVIDAFLRRNAIIIRLETIINHHEAFDDIFPSRRTTENRTMKTAHLILALLQVVVTWRAAAFPAVAPHNHRGTIAARRYPRPSSRLLALGWLDSFVPDFLKQREGDFVKLGETEGAYGPGPLLLLYDAPGTIEDSEILDMVDDEAPGVKHCKIFRIHGGDCDDHSDSLLDLSLQEALKQMSSGQAKPKQPSISAAASAISDSSQQRSIPVLFFSGFTNADMMAIYNVLGNEIFQETAGKATPACAKAVPNAMLKPLRQVLEEITGDHQDAIDMQKSDQRSFE